MLPISIRVRSYILLFVLFFFAGCKSDSKYPLETKILDAYLQEAFSEPIPKDKHLYIIVPVFHCKGCVSRAMRTLSAALEKNTPSISLIYSGDVVVDKNIEEKIHINFDQKSILESYNLEVGSVSLFTTIDGEIVKIKHYNTDNMIEFSDGITEYIHPKV
ncbi:MAG: hypothetical protein ACEPOV_02240 [Hyphomicrobiales bacterium]